MEHLNYCRQIAKQCLQMLDVPNVARSADADRYRHILALIQASQKFILPPQGRLLDDPEFRALDDAAALHLPHPFIALEYPITGEFVGYDPDCITKDVVFAWEAEDRIFVQRIGFSQAHGSWGLGKTYSLPRAGYLKEVVDGKRQFRYFAVDDGFDEAPDHHGAATVLCLLNALACSNVHVERSEPSKTRQAMRKKGALPFDTYHILTVDVPATHGTGAATGGHRSPREHLRRGHIRRYETGLKIWVNATVVNPGVGGKVSKDYAIRSR